MDKNPDSYIDSWYARLQASGYRLTYPRRTLVSIIASTTRSLTAVELFDLGRKLYPSLGLVTVYRTLERLEELELIQKVHNLEGCHAYLPAARTHEHILLCTNCGRVSFFSGDNLDDLMELVALQTGFQIHDHWLQLMGTCLSCRNPNQKMS